ncbi:MAG: adenylate/guanylate cyclase domain-containing protein [Armatimonadota bacterium]
MLLPKRTSATAANAVLAELEEVKASMAEIEARQDALLASIQESFSQAVVVFIDMVGSTEFKVTHVDEPARWMLRVYQFNKVLAAYVESLGGKVVKFIGDEVMAVFEGEACTTDACNLLVRVEEIETRLEQIIGVETRIKIAVDRGDVCFLKFEGHEPVDPQGTAIDRCARIGKKAVAGAVLASSEFVKACPGGFAWVEAGTLNCKGIGPTVVYQMGDTITADLTPKTEIDEGELRRLQERLAAAEGEKQKVEVEIAQLADMNEHLQQEIRNLGSTPSEDDSVAFADVEEEDQWTAIEGDIAELNRLLEEGPAPNDHARFVFLDQSGNGDTYNRHDRPFNTLIEAKLVNERRGDGYYYLDDEHPLNQAIALVAESLAEKLEQYEPEGRPLYRYSLDDPQFWLKEIGHYVL